MFTVLIPARYASTRLPGKPLLDIVGKPMVVRVGRARVPVVAARRRCHRRRAHPGGGRRSRHRCADDPKLASDRNRIASRKRRQLGLDDEAIVVNVQGDEPLLEPELIHTVADTLTAHADAAIGRLHVTLIDDPGGGIQPQRGQGRA